jgi:hypothetical protein
VQEFNGPITSLVFCTSIPWDGSLTVDQVWCSESDGPLMASKLPRRDSAAVDVAPCADESQELSGGSVA